MSNYTWKELEQKFSELAPQMSGARMDVQYGSVPTRYDIVGCGNQTALDRYYSYSVIAGQKLLSSSNKSEFDKSEELRGENNPVLFWLKVLREYSGKFVPDFIGNQTDFKTGESLGAIFVGRIQNIAEVSAIQCINFSLLFPDIVADETAKPHMNNSVKEETFLNKYLIPIIVSVIASVIAGIILLLI